MPSAFFSHLGRRRFVRRFLAVVAVAASAGALALPSHAADPVTVRIGYQKTGPLLLLKGTGALEQRLAPKGVTVTWTEFSSGPPLLEALNVGSLDFGTTGDTPPIFAQAAGADLLYVGRHANLGRVSAVLVRDDGPIKTLADLKGRKVAFVKGSNANNIVVEVLKRGGLTYKDIQPVNLSPADARAAFERGSVDAWAIWDPYFALAEHQSGVRVLTTAEGIVESSSFFLARRAFAQANPEILTILLEELDKAGAWAEANIDAVAEILARVNGIDLAVQKVAAARSSYRVGPVEEEHIRTQQGIADTFAELGLIPKRLTIRDTVWTPPKS